MSLQKKTLLIVGVTLLCLIALLYAVSYNLLLSSFAELEEQTTRRNVERVLSALADDLSNMDAILGDWAAWDDTYNFVGGTNEEYVANNLVDGTFINLRLSLMLFTDQSGAIVYGKAFDLRNEQGVPVPPSLLELLSQNASLLHHPTTASSITGLVLLPEGPLLIASQPIRTSADEGPIRGTLIMGRYLDAQEVERLAELTQLSLSLYRFNESPPLPELREATFALSKGSPIFIQPVGRESIAGFALIEDIYGKPALVLRVDQPRSIYLQGLATLRYLLLAVVSVGVVFLVLLVAVLNTLVLSPLAHFDERVRSIGASGGDLSKRIEIAGRDEFADLADSVNAMLASLERSQSALRESEEKYRAFFKTSRDPVFITSRDGKWIDANDAAVALFGYETRSDLFNVRVADLYEHADDRVEHIRHIEEQGATKDYPVNLRKKDGTVIPTLITSVAKRDDKGAVIGYQGTIRDITERKRAEEERERLIKDLEMRNAEMERFVYTISHELRTPLVTAQAYTGLLRRDLERRASEKVAADLHFIENAVSLMARLLEDTLELSRTGRVMNPPEDVPFSALVRDALVQLAEQLKWGGVEVAVAEDLPTVHVDRTRLVEVLVNLIENSIKFMGDQPKPKIEIGYRTADNEPVFFVKDNGVGLDKSQHEKVFQLFYRVDQKSKGAGAGLTIVKRIIEVHGGRIWIESELGKGCTVCFTLPVVEV
jgi:PAS domain S-box-containing protein